jgi:hypothetical protein
MSIVTIGKSHKQAATRLHARRRRAQGETIRMVSKRFGYFPQAFTWRGRHYNVHAVERCWTVSRRWLWEVERHCFRVRCAEGTFELYQDVKKNTWHIDRFERT